MKIQNLVPKNIKKRVKYTFVIHVCQVCYFINDDKS